ncbi:MAG: hypothetical protein HS104_18080 [Polyangiaceae bacterium]|nr:hypothetical protein [Polyangiaceae bacterium]MCE7890544.1 hypothetical protein [Sorangiineae bacterium PRO1]MCL4753346.1 hypothetical protein [Myxococcales bacterium]
MGRWCAVALSLLAPSVASAQSLWAEGSVRASYVAGTYSFTDEVNPGYGQTGTLELEAPIDAMGLELGGVLGYADSKYFAVGAGPSVLVAGTNAELGESSFSLTSVAALSLEAAIRPLGDGLFLRPSVGLARSRPLASSTNDIGSAENIFEVETVTGPIVGLGAGWAAGLFGVSVKVSYAHLEAERTKFRPLMICVGVLVQHWDLDEGAPRAR